MTLQDIRSNLGDYAKDIKLNLGKVMEEDGAPGLTQVQIHSIALAAAYATRQPDLIAGIEAETSATLSETQVTAAQAAATIMAMNNIYYRFTHMVGDKDYASMPAGLRMNVIGNPGIEKVDFELMCLGVSAMNGCGACMESHAHEVVKAGIAKQGVQSTIRIASVIQATAQALDIQAYASAGNTSQAA